MSFAEEQEQHKIAQVYMKQFGYKHNNQNWISVCERGSPEITNKPIKSFLKSTNVFDLPVADNFVRRSFENLNGELETKYPKIITELETEKLLSKKSEAVLYQTIANLLCRTDYFRGMIRQFLSSDKKDAFLNLVLSKLSNEKAVMIQTKIRKYKAEELINLICVFVQGYLIHELAYLPYVIIESHENKGWMTSDCPVVLHNHFSIYSIFEIDTVEVVFPISKNLVSYFFNERATSRIVSGKFKNRDYLLADAEMQDVITWKISCNDYNYLLLPCKIETGTRIDT